MVIIVEPLLHLPGHFKTYTYRLLNGFAAQDAESISFLGTFSSDPEFERFQNISEHLKIIRQRPSHPFISTIFAGLRLFTDITIKRDNKIYFIDYHFISMVLIYPLLCLRFKNIILTHPGSTLPLGKLSFINKIKAHSTYFFAHTIGRIARRQIYHSNLVKDQYFHPIIGNSKSAVVEWGIIRSPNLYPYQVNREILEANLIQVVGFGRLEKRKGVSKFIQWIEEAALFSRYKVNVTLLGTVDPLYLSELEDIVGKSKNVSIVLKNYAYSDEELQNEILKSHFALLAYDKSFTAASGVMSDIVGFGIPMLTCEDCIFSNYIKNHGIGFSINYDAEFSGSMEGIANFFLDSSWLGKIESLSCNTWNEVAAKHLNICD